MYCESCAKLIEENGRLRAALEFYAKPENLEEFAKIYDNEFKGTS